MAKATGTELMGEATELMSNGTELMNAGDQRDSNFTGGFLQTGEVLEGWEITGRLDVSSLEAEVYRAKKDGKEGIVKYYRGITKPKTDILEKIQGLNHENIVNLYKFGLYKGRLFEIMEYAAGGGLDSRNEDGSYKYLPLSEEELIGVCEEIIGAFDKCHSMNIIHRDIKPGNIFYRECSSAPDENGRYKGKNIVIGDFGISSIMEEGEQYRKTRTANRTSAYAAPEVLYGEINEKYDYYSLGVTLWELAMGKVPFLMENGKQLDSTLIMQNSILGDAANDLLRIKPLLSEKIQRLIRGLLVVNPEHRWGYKEVKDHLSGKEVTIIPVEKKEFNIDIGDKKCTTLEELAEAILDKPEAAREKIFKGQLKSVLERKFPEISKRVEEIAKKASAKRDYYSICKIAWSLSLNVPFKPGNGYEARGVDGISNLIANAPETMLPLLKDKNSRLYAYLEVVDKKEEADEIQVAEEIRDIAATAITPLAADDKPIAEEIWDIAATAGNAELISKTLVILCGRVIKPYKLAKYRDFILDTPENLTTQKEIPDDLKKRILLLIKEKSCEGLVYPWIDLHLKEKGVNEYDPKTWDELIGLFGEKRAA